MPMAFGRMRSFLSDLLAIAACALYFVRSSYRPTRPAVIQTAPRPDFFFLWLMPFYRCSAVAGLRPADRL